jgi:hypothetical protein
MRTSDDTKRTVFTKTPVSPVLPVCYRPVEKTVTAATNDFFLRTASTIETCHLVTVGCRETGKTGAQLLLLPDVNGAQLP